MSFKEKSVWACLVTTLLVYAGYFWAVVRLFSEGEFSSSAAAKLFIAAVVAQVVMLIVVHILFASKSSDEAEDERDAAIASKANRNGSAVLGAFVFLSIMGLISWEVIRDWGGSEYSPSPLMIAQALLLSMVIAETTYFLTQAICYRRGI